MTLKSLPFLRNAWKKLLLVTRYLVCFMKYCKTPSREWLRFRCNICGKAAAFPKKELQRESWSCRTCASTVRWRSVIHALSVELFGKSLALPDFPYRPDLVGVGLSDWDGYADGLSAKLGYTNTFYHQAPLLDITNIDTADHPQYDFIISSDVFEHICPPVSRAFANAGKLLKPEGVMILTVPYIEGETREHFPEVRDFFIKKEANEWVLVGKSDDQQTQTYTGLTFHGGPGTVVECRLFGKESLVQASQDAGFKTIRIHAEAAEQFGIIWLPYRAEDAPYRPLILGLDTPPWALVKGSTMHMANGRQHSQPGLSLQHFTKMPSPNMRPGSF